MRTAESRDRMVARVQAAFAAKPTFEAWPEVGSKDGNISAAVQKPVSEADYITALHEICAVGEPIGRRGDALVGRRIDDEAPAHEGKRITGGRGKGA